MKPAKGMKPAKAKSVPSIRQLQRRGIHIAPSKLVPVCPFIGCVLDPGDGHGHHVPRARRCKASVFPTGDNQIGRCVLPLDHDGACVAGGEVSGGEKGKRSFASKGCGVPGCIVRDCWLDPAEHGEAAPVVPVCAVAGCVLDPATHSHVGIEVAPKARASVRAAMRREAARGGKAPQWTDAEPAEGHRTRSAEDARGEGAK